MIELSKFETEDLSISWVFDQSSEIESDIIPKFELKKKNKYQKNE